MAKVELRYEDEVREKSFLAEVLTLAGGIDLRLHNREDACVRAVASLEVGLDGPQLLVYVDEDGAPLEYPVIIPLGKHWKGVDVS